ncbi:phage tail protein [Ideonella sp. A 288]|uniref:phage tail protein n=1 Tax=Ideonella sp. A 288 TaxID=1962181 RepID=UPI000B4BF62B|nr:tail fiber protein [Ideonella sp. A 288]
MSDPYVGEIRMFAGNFPPNGWAFCDGSLLPIAEFEVLFTLVGTTYGGDGQATFALPDLRGRVPLHQGGGQTIGQSGGSETVRLLPQHNGAHGHALVATSAAASSGAGPSGMLASSATAQYYGSGPATTPMIADALTAAGGGQPHENMAPFLTVSFIISLFGIFPSAT